MLARTQSSRMRSKESASFYSIHMAQTPPSWPALRTPKACFVFGVVSSFSGIGRWNTLAAAKKIETPSQRTPPTFR